MGKTLPELPDVALPLQLSDRLLVNRSGMDSDVSLEELATSIALQIMALAQQLATQEEAETGADVPRYMNPRRVLQAIDARLASLDIPGLGAAALPLNDADKLLIRQGDANFHVDVLTFRQAVDDLAVLAQVAAELARDAAEAFKLEAEDARDAAQAALANLNVFENTTEGLDNTEEAGATNRYFGVPSVSPSETYITLYRNSAGVAVAINTYPAASALHAAIKAGAVFAELYPALPENYPGYLVGIRDTQGALRIIDWLNPATGEVERHGKIMDPLLARLSALGVEKIVITPNNYPSFLRLIPDDEGHSRVIEGHDAAGDWRQYGAVASSGGSGNLELTATEYVVIIILGQSNAVGRGSQGLSPAVTATAGIMWNPTTESWEALADPVQGHEDDAADGSAWPAMANEFFRMTGLGLAVIQCAKGGTAMQASADTGSGNWSSSGTLQASMLAEVNQALAALTAAGVAWQLGAGVLAQGEKDAERLAVAAAGVTKDGYKETLVEDLYATLKSNFGSDFDLFLIRTGTAGAGADPQAWKDIRAAQDEVCRENEHIHMAYTGTFKFYGRGLMDGTSVHYNQLGLNEIGRKVARVVAATATSAA